MKRLLFSLLIAAFLLSACASEAPQKAASEKTAPSPSANGAPPGGTGFVPYSPCGTPCYTSKEEPETEEDFKYSLPPL